jgi:hypothetical protein
MVPAEDALVIAGIADPDLRLHGAGRRTSAGQAQAAGGHMPYCLNCLTFSPIDLSESISTPPENDLGTRLGFI